MVLIDDDGASVGSWRIIDGAAQASSVSQVGAVALPIYVLLEASLLGL
jgi:hypothetical protein